MIEVMGKGTRQVWVYFIVSIGAPVQWETRGYCIDPGEKDKGRVEASTGRKKLKVEIGLKGAAEGPIDDVFEGPVKCSGATASAFDGTIDRVIPVKSKSSDERAIKRECAGLGQRAVDSLIQRAVAEAAREAG